MHWRQPNRLHQCRRNVQDLGVSVRDGGGWRSLGHLAEIKGQSVNERALLADNLVVVVVRRDTAVHVKPGAAVTQW